MRYEDTRDVYTEREVSATSRDIGRIDYPEDAAFIAAAPVDVARLTRAIEDVLELHQPEKRWMPYEGADVSYDTEQDAREAAEDYELGAVALEGVAENGHPFFEVCGHCKTVEEGACEGECTKELGYLTSLWPCPTVAAIENALNPKEGQ